ncbi:hypothetical protein TREMEDRAFT_66432 [Tremella mesenterica DSM 1558]|uniref:uncharacterized protein n=1 Tax=Tremella mesenterica (strain ATCC 24925 / CBS 8224 / DSM 1558 / NBRC 9311 / NRRL Y-6157 / RJB 2259-6 / UBC 559-6) TaxID=578456 RepID=UPI00032CE89D|nr:uncharacterized protein TREMEDRAFT_66432 [Tremella mesenterica DSM 1558]EIW65602.1 hypothetical protein TREMEDRAFT_66432 [Tremella mesenterica DSM 1558]
MPRLPPGPYHLPRSGGGSTVINTDTGNRHRCPLEALTGRSRKAGRGNGRPIGRPGGRDRGRGRGRVGDRGTEGAAGNPVTGNGARAGGQDGEDGGDGQHEEEEEEDAAGEVVVEDDRVRRSRGKRRLTHSSTSPPPSIERLRRHHPSRSLSFHPTTPPSPNFSALGLGLASPTSPHHQTLFPISQQPSPSFPRGAPRTLTRSPIASPHRPLPNHDFISPLTGKEGVSENTVSADPTMFASTTAISPNRTISALLPDLGGLALEFI